MKFRFVHATTLSPAQKREFVRLAEEFRDTQPAGWREEIVPHFDPQAMVAFVGHQMAGYATYNPSAAFVFFRNVYVRPKFQNKGLARLLISKTVSHVSKESGVQTTSVGWFRSKNLRSVWHARKDRGLPPEPGIAEKQGKSRLKNAWSRVRGVAKKIVRRQK